MTVNAVAFYAIAALILIAAGAAVGLTSLRLAAYAGAAVVLLLAVLELLAGADALAVVQVVVPGIAVGIVFLALRQDQYRGLGSSPEAPVRFWIAAPIAVALAVLLFVVFSQVGPGWFPGNFGSSLVAVYGQNALITVLHYRAPYALAIAVVLVLVSAGAGLVIGRRSGDEQTLDQHLAQRRERDEIARRRRQDREQGRRRQPKSDA
jgi:multisubunit Na+/H+ antiporter MnhB subunit